MQSSKIKMQKYNEKFEILNCNFDLCILTFEL
jgi:hypothetical protein